MRKLLKYGMVLCFLLSLVGCSRPPEETDDVATVTDYCTKELSDGTLYELTIVSKDDAVISMLDSMTGDITGYDSEELEATFEEVIATVKDMAGVEFDYNIEGSTLVRNYHVVISEASNESLQSIGFIDRALDEGEYISREVTVGLNESNGYSCSTK